MEPEPPCPHGALAEPADAPDALLEIKNTIPITIDMMISGRRIRELILWDRTYKSRQHIEAYVRQTILDQDLPVSAFDALVGTISDQITRSVVMMVDGSRECLHQLKLDIWLGGLHLRHELIWDVNEPRNSPSAFAEQLVSDLGLGARDPFLREAWVRAVRFQLVQQVAQISATVYRAQQFGVKVNVLDSQIRDVGPPVRAEPRSLPHVAVAERWFNVPPE